MAGRRPRAERRGTAREARSPRGRRCLTGSSARSSCRTMLRAWLVGRRERSIGAYWPIKGEFDPLPALYRWTEGSARRRRRAGSACRSPTARPARCAFTSGIPGCEMELDAYDIPKPKDTDEFLPQLLVVPCLGFGPGGVRLGYGGGFFDRTLRALQPAARHGRRQLHPRLPAVPARDARRPAARCLADRRRRDVAAALSRASRLARFRRRRRGACRSRASAATG